MYCIIKSSSNGKIGWKHRPSTQKFYRVCWNLLNGPKHRGSILKNMASSEGYQLLVWAFHAIIDKIAVDIFQIANKWNWRWTFIYQGYVFRKILAINASFAIKYAHLLCWSLKFGQNCKDVPAKILKRDARTKAS